MLVVPEFLDGVPLEEPTSSLLAQLAKSRHPTVAIMTLDIRFMDSFFRELVVDLRLNLLLVEASGEV
jgi:hypothetical protein